jgi:uncharacterized protein YbjT (DUF2867 family)
VILVTGATGTVGSEVVRQLRAMAAPVRLMARDPSKAQPAAAAGAQVVAGDFSDPVSVQRALEGCDRIFILAPVHERMAEFEALAVDTARMGGVRHAVLLSAVGADSESPAFFLRCHGEGELALNASGLSATILRPGFFMDNLLASSGTIKSQGTFFGIWGSAKLAAIDARDIGAVAAQVLVEGKPHHGKVYTLTGPRALSGTEQAAVLSAVLGRPITYTDLPREQYTRALLSMGMPAWLATAVTDLDRLAISGESAKVTDVVERIAKKPPRTFERWVRDHADAFR